MRREDWEGVQAFRRLGSVLSAWHIPPRASTVARPSRCSLVSPSTRREFVRNFRLGSDFLYRNQLLQRYRRGQYWLEINIGHLHDYEARLLKHLQDQPAEYLPVYEKGAREALSQLLLEAPAGGDGGKGGVAGGDGRGSR